MRDLNQLLLNFEYKQNFKDEDFYVSKSNYFAFNLINSWPKWEKNFLNISGDKFSGKSHLTNIFLKKFKGIKIDANSLENEKLQEDKTDLKEILNSQQYKDIANKMREIKMEKEKIRSFLREKGIISLL